MRFATLAANIGMALSVAQAGQIVACTAYDVEKADQASEQSISKKAHDTFESQFIPAAMQKVAQIIGSPLAALPLAPYSWIKKWAIQVLKILGMLRGLLGRSQRQ
ncbi:MAG: hypothetical protein ACKO3R_02000 [bacterium]